MRDGYTEQQNRLDALSKTLAIIANDFKEEKCLEKAIAGYVLSSMILKQLESIDAELDFLIEQMGI